MTVLWLLCIYGFCVILGQSKIFSALRRDYLRPALRELVECPTCLGFWAGLGLSASFYGPVQEALKPGIHWGILALLDGFVVSGVNTILHALVSYLTNAGAWYYEQAAKTGDINFGSSTGISLDTHQPAASLPEPIQTEEIDTSR